MKKIKAINYTTLRKPDNSATIAVERKKVYFVEKIDGDEVVLGYGAGTWLIKWSDWQVIENDDGEVPKAAIALIKEFEGLHLEAYADPLHGWEVPTIGYGTILYPDGNEVEQGDRITEKDAEMYLEEYIQDEIISDLEEIPTWGQMNDNQRSALISFAYNLGSYFYGGDNFSSITKVCDRPVKWSDHKWVEAQFIKYRNPGTNVEVGLMRRRKAEAKLFCTPVSEAVPSLPETQLKDTIIALCDTFVKSEPEDSSTLTDEQKQKYSQGDVIELCGYEKVQNHHRIKYLLGETKTTSYIYSPHWEFNLRSPYGDYSAQDVIKLDVPYFRQIDNYTGHFGTGYRQCNLTCCAMLADYLLDGQLTKAAQERKWKEPESVYGNILKRYGDTVYHVNQTKALEELEIKSSYESTSVNLILASLRKGIPVVVGVKYKSWGHIVLVVGYSATSSVWYVHDPYGVRHGIADSYSIGANGAYDSYSMSLFNSLYDGNARIIEEVKGRKISLA